MRTIVEAGARLHLGFLDLNGACGRRFGSIGVALERPRARWRPARRRPGGARARRSPCAASWSASGPTSATGRRRRAGARDDPAARGVRRRHPARPGGGAGRVAGRGSPALDPRAGAAARAGAALRASASRPSSAAGSSSTRGIRPRTTAQRGCRTDRRAGAAARDLPASPARRLALRPGDPPRRARALRASGAARVRRSAADGCGARRPDLPPHAHAGRAGGARRGHPDLRRGDHRDPGRRSASTSHPTRAGASPARPGAR